MRHNFPVITKGPLGDRLRSTPRFLRIIEQIHAAGPRPTAEMLIEFLEAEGADPVALDRLHRWASIDPRIVRQLGGDRFPRPPLDPAPRGRKG